MQGFRLVGRVGRSWYTARLREGVVPSFLFHKSDGGSRFFHKEDGAGHEEGAGRSSGICRTGEFPVKDSSGDDKAEVNHSRVWDSYVTSITSSDSGSDDDESVDSDEDKAHLKQSETSDSDEGRVHFKGTETSDSDEDRVHLKNIESDEDRVHFIRSETSSDSDADRDHFIQSEISESDSDEDRVHFIQSETSESDSDGVHSQRSETSESEDEEEDNDVEKAGEDAEKTVQAQAQEIVGNQLMLAAETSSESEQEEVPARSPTSVLYKLSIRQVAKILRKLRAIDLKILNVQSQCQWTDYMVFATGRTTRHIRGMADRIVHAVKKRSTQDNHMLFPSVEGRECTHWMVVDCGDIVVHCFSEEARARYNLERKWGGQEVFMEDLNLKPEEEKKDKPPRVVSAAELQAKKKKKMTKKMKKKAAIAAAKRSTYVPPEPLPC